MSKSKPNPILQAIYDKIPEVHCKGLCQCFCGPIGMSGAEYTRMVAHAPFKPEHVEEQGLIFLPMSPHETLKAHLNDMDGTSPCEFLNRAGGCMVYKDRPLICRVWGASQDPLLICPHGCVPDRWLSKPEVDEMMETARGIV